MMNKENTLFAIIGLLAGLIIGFMFANSVNQTAMTSVARQDSAMPPGHPDVTGGELTGQQSGAIPEVQAAIEKARQESDNFDAQIKAAELYYQIQRFDSALEFLKRANQLRPEDYGTIVQLGNANFDLSNYDEAEKWYMSALSKKANDVNVRTDLGLTFVFRNDPNYDRAIQEFKRSLELDPKHVQTLQNLTVAYSKKGDTENAKATLAKLETLDPSNPAIAKLREGL